MRSRFHLPLLTLLLCIISFCYSYSAPRAQTAQTPAWVLSRTPDYKIQPKNREIDNGYYISLYDEQVNVATHGHYMHIIRDIVNESGIQTISELAFSFTPDYEQLVFHKVSIWREGKEINKLDVSKIKVINDESSLSSHQVSGDYSAIVILDDMRKGDRVDIAYSINGENPIYNNVYSDNFTFASNVPITNNYTTVIAPASRKLYMKSYNKVAYPKIINKDGNNIYDWPVTQLNAYDYSPNTPSWYSGYPYVEISEYASWAAVAAWANQVMNHYQYTLPAELKKKIDKWYEASGNNPVAFAEKAARFVQDEVRYMGLEIGENSHRPHIPAETFNKRYGDCKDKSLLLTMILRYKNIPAYVALVNTSVRDHMDEHQPAATWFDHAIVQTSFNGIDVWIDPTMSLQRGDIRNTYIPNYGKALVIADNTTGLKEIVRQGNGIVNITEVYTIPTGNDSTARLESNTTYAYAQGDDTRSTFSNTSLKNIEESYEDFYRNTYKHVKLDGSITYEDDTESNIITIKESYTIDSIWESKSGDKEYFEIVARALYQRLPAVDEKTRDKPLALPYPLTIRYKAIVNMPSDWSLDEKPLTIKNGSYEFSFTPTLYNNQVTLEYSFQTLKDHIPVDEIAEYKKDYSKMVGAMDYSFSYNKSFVNKVNKATTTPLGNINWIAVFICILTAVGAFFLMRYFNRKEYPNASYTLGPERISGWLYLLGLILLIRIGMYIYAFSGSPYLSTTSWMVMNEYGQTGFQLLLLLEMITQVAFTILSVYVFYWFMTRRDAFPNMFYVMILGELAFNIFFMMMGIIFKDIDKMIPGYVDAFQKAAGKSVFGILIWGSAVYWSPIVKRVFITPYKYKPLVEDPGYEATIALNPVNHPEATGEKPDTYPPDPSAGASA